jgi:tetratricopeptide (TPR) repeat protein
MHYMMLRSLTTAILLSAAALSTAQPGPDKEALARQYVQLKEYDKAIPIYQQLYEEAPFDKPIYTAYLDALMNAEQFVEAEKLIQYMAKIRRDDPSITLDLAQVYERTNKKKLATDQYELLLESVDGDEYNTVRIADAFTRSGNHKYAIKTYEKARSIRQNPYIYATELAPLYAADGQSDKAVEALLDMALLNPASIDDVKTALLQVTEGDAKKNAAIQKQVNARFKNAPDNPAWTELLTWIFTQNGDYVGALKQITEWDKRLNEDGARVLNFAHRSFSDGQYAIALKAYDYVLAKGTESYLYERACVERLNVQLEQLKQTRPIDKALTDSVILAFDQLFTQFPQQQWGPLLRDYATVQARFAHNTDTAIALLEAAVKTNGLSRELNGLCKLDLGDYYILNNKVWDASLTYSQVDKAFKQDVLGEEARFRNAKLAYYRGDFDWAQGQLSVLKASTTELIANDALYLSVLITENTPPDSDFEPLLRFATADLLLFQNKTQASDLLLDSIATAFPETPLQDDILMQRAKIALEEGRNDDAINFLEKIASDYGDDVLGDDAVFKLANIYEQQKVADKALKYYERLITDYPGSTFVQSARAAYARLSKGEKKSL